MKQPQNVRDASTGRIVERIETVEVDGVLYSEQWVLGEPCAGAFDPGARKALREAWQLPAEEERMERDRETQEAVKNDELPALLASPTLSGQDVLAMMVGLGVLRPSAARARGWTPPEREPPPESAPETLPVRGSR